MLTPDSLLELIRRFLHLEKKIIVLRGDEGKRQEKRETLIFPRYHQRDCVRALTSHARTHGSGRNYLIQHSAGSGKSNSIAWLAYRLSSLHDKNDEKIFHSVIVISDRKILDSQLQDTIYQFEHKRGVVEKIDQSTKQLVQALANNTPIIISTLQKFPFIMNEMKRLIENREGVNLNMEGKRFAVIVDEAHSSQTGEAARQLRGILNKDGIEAAIADQLDDTEDDTLSDDAKAQMLKDIASRARQPNLSFFAFTATPKFKTAIIFDEPGPTGTSPFHLYSMRQAIEEGFILDVLKNYTTYRAYYGLIKKIQDDPELPKRQAAKKLARFAHSHPVNITQKVEVIIEHFRTNVRHKLDGRAKGMVVTSSRLDAVRYKNAFDQYVKNKGYNDVRALVAFSGEVQDEDLPGQKFTETGMNDGISERTLPEKFAGPDYQVLIVADKYQTGFDEPLLSAMYVDKIIAGVRAVQTFSRLNRTMTGKENTFILDFVNKAEDIYKAFKPYYETTAVGEEPDPQRLYELQDELMLAGIIYKEDINEFAKIWFERKEHLSQLNHASLNKIIQEGVARFLVAEEETKIKCRDDLTAFKSLYGFLSQIIPYRDTDLEKLNAYGYFLLKALPRGSDKSDFRIENDVDLKFYRLESLRTGSINLAEGEAEALKGPTDVGTGKMEDEVKQLSEIIANLNERFGTDFTAQDNIFFDQLAEAAIEKSELRNRAFANSFENFKLIFERVFQNILLERTGKNDSIAQRIFQDKEFQQEIMENLAKRVYIRIRSDGASK